MDFFFLMSFHKCTFPRSFFTHFPFRSYNIHTSHIVCRVKPFLKSEVILAFQLQRYFSTDVMYICINGSYGYFAFSEESEKRKGKKELLSPSTFTTVGRGSESEQLVSYKRKMKVDPANTVLFLPHFHCYISKLFRTFTYMCVSTFSLLKPCHFPSKSKSLREAWMETLRKIQGARELNWQSQVTVTSFGYGYSYRVEKYSISSSSLSLSGPFPVEH